MSVPECPLMADLRLVRLRTADVAANVCVWNKRRAVVDGGFNPLITRTRSMVRLLSGPPEDLLRRARAYPLSRTTRAFGR